jgi:hypothetical protein
MTDLVIAFANAGLSVIFFPTIWQNIRNSHCGIPLTTSIPRTGLIALLCGTYLAMGLYLAGGVLLIDIGCWLILIRQRRAL